jgi:hypothetical protein
MFPRTQIENLSVSRLMIGTNWLLGFSHTSAATDRFIRETVDAQRITDILTVALAAGVDTFYGVRPEPKLVQGIAEAEQRAGRKVIMIAIPTLPTGGDAASLSEAARILDEYAALGVSICMPHQATTDALVNRRARADRHRAAAGVDSGARDAAGAFDAHARDADLRGQHRAGCGDLHPDL